MMELLGIDQKSRYEGSTKVLGLLENRISFSFERERHFGKLAA